jgi:hypothetical protein
MPLYPVTILRCQHIKVNGTQCGSPELRNSKFCYYHIRYHWPELEALGNINEWRMPLPTLEDANSIQVSLAKVMERLILLEIEPKTAALMLYALQIASANLKRISLEPEMPTQVVIDRESVAHRPIGATAWSRVAGREYDEDGINWQDEDPFVLEDEDDPVLKVKWDHMLKFAIDREIALDPACGNKTLGEMSVLLPNNGISEWRFPDPGTAAKDYAERIAVREKEGSDPSTAQNSTS